MPAEGTFMFFENYFWAFAGMKPHPHKVTIRGYHVYRYVWTIVVNKELDCQREIFNTADPFTIAAVKKDAIGSCDVPLPTCPPKKPQKLQNFALCKNFLLYVSVSLVRLP